MIQTTFKIRGTLIIGIIPVPPHKKTPHKAKFHRRYTIQATRFNINKKTMKITGLINTTTGKTQKLYRIKKCQWCGRKYNPSTSNQKYCNPQCRQYGDQEHTMIRVRKYRKKYRQILRETITSNKIGTGHLGQHMCQDWNEEINKIRKEMRELGINTLLSY